MKYFTVCQIDVLYIILVCHFVYMTNLCHVLGECQQHVSKGTTILILAVPLLLDMSLHTSMCDLRCFVPIRWVSRSPFSFLLQEMFCWFLKIMIKYNLQTHTMVWLQQDILKMMIICIKTQKLKNLWQHATRQSDVGYHFAPLSCTF